MGDQHLKEARHINTLRNMAYRYPTKRSFWLSIWYSSIEKVEKENPWALAFDETEEIIYLKLSCLVALDRKLASENSALDLGVRGECSLTTVLMSGDESERCDEHNLTLTQSSHEG